MMVDSGHRIQRYAWFNSEYMHCVSLRSFSVKVDSDPEVRIGLWRLTPLSWRRGRFPWFAFLRFSCCSTLIRWSPSFVLVPQFSGADVEETSELPQLQPVDHGHCCCHACCVQQQVPYGSECRHLRWSRSCSALTW